MIVAGIVTGALCGALICFAVFLPLYGKPNWEIRTLTATLALSFIGTNVLLQGFGPTYKAIPEIFGSGHFSLAGAVVTADKTGTVVYAGAIDNSPDGESKSPQGGKLVNYVDAALGDLAAGREVQTAVTRPYGCSVKYGS